MSGSVDIKRKIIGFKTSEKIKVCGENYFEAFVELGKKQKNEIAYRYAKCIKDIKPERLERGMKKAGETLAYMESLSESGAFKIDGINYLQRYMNAFYGTCQGSGLGYVEGMLLQSENPAGCQTIMVQDKGTGKIRIVHAEEDSEFSRFGGEYRYKVVDIKAGSNKIVYFSYPELFGWGPAFGVNETTGMTVVVDDLIALKKYTFGNFCVMAIAYMALDCGKMETVEKIVGKICSLPGFRFESGYSIHIADIGETGPRMRSIECIDNKVEYIVPEDREDRKIIAQPNCSLVPGFDVMTAVAKPVEGEWEYDEARLHVEMKTRRERLLRQAENVDWKNKDPQESIEAGLELLADPEGDTNQYLDKRKKKFIKYYTGLPTRMVVAHFVCYLDGDTLSYYIGKLTPKPIPGKEFLLKYREDYKYNGEDLAVRAREEILLSETGE